MNTVIEAISTVIERNILVNFLYQLDYFAFKKGVSIKDFIVSNLPVKMREDVCKYFSQEIENGDFTALVTKGKSLIKEIETLPVITLSVIKNPSDEQIYSISNWIKENTGIKVLLNFVEVEDVVGGAIVESKGYVRDYTIRRYFEKRKEDNYGL
jgi:F0F1-type ATP synthase delta subunit